MQVLAVDGVAQSRKLNLKIENVSMTEVLDRIENETDYFFFYNNKVVSLDQNVSVDLTNKTINEVLDVLFKDSDILYTVKDRQIILSASKDATNAKQQKTVTGKITDSAGLPLPGVSVIIKGTTTGTITDFDGKFTLTDVSNDATLVFSFIGMLSQEMAVIGKSTFSITMENDVTGIDEVIVVGYGTQKKLNVTGSVVQIGNEDFMKRPITDASQVLQGLASGVYVSQASGEPGNDIGEITIRGVSSIGGSNAPLVLVDGVPGDMNSISPDDIESVSVLKDAASSAIYGSRAANGVILITTKRGSKGSAKISFDIYTGVQEVTTLPEMVSDPIEFMDLVQFGINQPHKGMPADGGGEYYPWYSDYDGMKATAQAYMDANNFKGTDMFDVLFSTASITKANLSVSGGTDKTNYFISTSFIDQEGTLMGTGMKQGSVRLNLDSQVTDKVKVGATFTSIYQDIDSYYTDNAASTGNEIYLNAFSWNPMSPVYTASGYYGVKPFFDEKFRNSNNSGHMNPVANINESSVLHTRLKANTNVYLEF